MVWRKKFGPAQKILGPVKGQGISFSNPQFPNEIINFGSLFTKANSTSEQQQHPNNAVLRLQSDLSKLKTKCNTYEKENFELRRLLGGD